MGDDGYLKIPEGLLKRDVEEICKELESLRKERDDTLIQNKVLVNLAERVLECASDVPVSVLKLAYKGLRRDPSKGGRIQTSKENRTKRCATSRCDQPSIGKFGMGAVDLCANHAPSDEPIL